MFWFNFSSFYHVHLTLLNQDINKPFDQKVVKTGDKKMTRNISRISLLLSIIFLLSINCENHHNSKNIRILWPEIEPFLTNYLKVSDIHEIYYELCGNPEGKPVFVIHGGPGAGCSPYMRQFFNPDKFLIVLHDQRGAGKSRPKAEIRENTTQELVEDIERLRKKLDLGKIILFGGSWGSTLSLTYAETYPDNVSSLVLRGIWFASKEEEDNFRNGIPKFFPDTYESFVNALPDSIFPSIDKMLKLIQSEDRVDREKYAKLFSRYEYKACGLNIKDESLDEYYESEKNIDEIYTNALLEVYYASNGCFLEEGQLLRDTYRIQNISTIIVNGRYDIVCPPFSAYRLHKKLPKSKLIIVEKAGHLLSEKPIELVLLKAMHEFE
jgi:proline iminopeptidase